MSVHDAEYAQAFTLLGFNAQTLRRGNCFNLSSSWSIGGEDGHPIDRQESEKDAAENRARIPFSLEPQADADGKKRKAEHGPDDDQRGWKDRRLACESVGISDALLCRLEPGLFADFVGPNAHLRSSAV